MKKSISIWAFPDGLNIEACMKTAKEAGFDGIELALNENGPLGLESSAVELQGYKTAAEKIGLEISGLATGLYWQYSLTSTDDKVREKARVIVRKQLHSAKELGVDAILVVPGNITADEVGGTPVSYDVAYDMALAALKELASEAEACGVTIGVENVWNKFLLSPLEMRQFVDAVGSPYVQVYFDAGNVLQFGFPEQWIRILDKRIVRVHIKDFKLATGNISGFVDLLSGDVNFPAVMTALRAVGYDGWVTAEISPYRFDAKSAVHQASAAMNTIFSMG